MEASEEAIRERALETRHLRKLFGFKFSRLLDLTRLSRPEKTKCRRFRFVVPADGSWRCAARLHSKFRQCVRVPWSLEVSFVMNRLHHHTLRAQLRELESRRQELRAEEDTLDSDW